MSQETRNVVCRGVRGATTAPENTAEAILHATHELLERMVEANAIDPRDLASAIFTLTSDLNAAYPAAAARHMGWTEIPLLCMQEIDKLDALPAAIRVLLHWNTATAQADIKHVYMQGTEVLRPDLADKFTTVSSTPQEK